MARIASDAGLRQSSLYYYFHSKEEILAALVARANVVPLELIDQIETEGGRAGCPALPLHSRRCDRAVPPAVRYQRGPPLRRPWARPLR